MDNNKKKEVKDKLAGTIMEAQGVLTNDKALELKGKARQTKGKAHGMVADIKDQTHDAKDKFVGSVKEKAGEVSNIKPLELKGKAEQKYAEADKKDKVLFGLGVLSALFFIVSLLVFLLGDDEE
ncbi:MAG: CsbD family protein [Atopostipes suicloacalis]|nr:CsbD family protein [Atopostipes suicloacalis]